MEKRDKFVIILRDCYQIVIGIRNIFTTGTFAAAILATASVFVAFEGVWGTALHRHWTFIVIVILMLLSLGCAAFEDFKKKSYGSLSGHLGLFLILFGGLAGAPDRVEMQLVLFNGEEEELPLPFSLSLNDFRIDYYEDGTSPRQYTSILSVDGNTMQTCVNHPCRYRGYRIYQSGYDADSGRYSILKIVRDPWLPLLTVGALMLVIAAFIGLKQAWNSWKILVGALGLAAVFAVISVARINFGTLMPALRSLWFVPHLIVYMLAYAVMAISVIFGIISLFSAKVSRDLSGRLLRTASSLLLIGMVCGAVWANQAWGNYWTWDAKECWAAVTWLLTLAGMHLPKKKFTLIFTVLAFLAMQVTWYGVNYLPAASQSLHTYNR